MPDVELPEMAVLKAIEAWRHRTRQPFDRTVILAVVDAQRIHDETTSKYSSPTTA